MPSDKERMVSLEPAAEPSAVLTTAPVRETDAKRSFWKYYLPLILIIFVLMGLVAMLVFKLFSLRAWLGGRKSTPGSMTGLRVLPPEWDLHDLSEGSDLIRRFDKARVTVGRDDKNDLMLPKTTVSSLRATIEYR